MTGPSARNPAGDRDGARVVLVDGVRTPFLRSGTGYSDLMSVDLARTALKGMLTRTGLEPSLLDAVIMGVVVQNPRTSNVARDAALGAGVPNTVAAHTVTMACISSSRAVADAVQAIRSGYAGIVAAGGVEVLSDVPIGFSKDVRKRFFESRKYKNPLEWRRFLQGLSPSDLLPRAPAIAEYSTGEVMGESADRLAAAWGVTREEQDAYALRSHRLAAEATEAGKLRAQILPTAVPPDFEPLERDNTFRADTSMDKLAALKPAFVKPFGTVTAGNSSPLTDGASVVLIMREDVALAHGYRPKAVLRDHAFVAQDPQEELLLGPAYAAPRLLDAAGLAWSDVDAIEMHEAFAGQVLAVLAALGSDAFGRERLGKGGAYADVDLERINRWGGSLSLGHPFGATGARLVAQAADRLIDEDGRFALVTACAAGGLGHAMLIERYDA